MSSLLSNPRKTRIWHFLSKATGYSAIYCRMVVQGDRSQTSKGGKKIMKKYKELNKILNHEK